MALIKALSRDFDLVLIDTPALLPVIDAAILASLVDGVLLVVSLGRSRREDVETTCKQLVAGRAQLIGAIANRARLGRPRLKRRYRQTAVRDWAGSTTI